MTRVVNIRTDAYDVYIGRAGNGKDGYFGNPFRLVSESKRKEVLEKYREYFLNRYAANRAFRNRVDKLKGKTLGCFCKPLACHGDIIAEFLDAPTGVFA